MPELHPPDATLLALQTDPATGVEYIPTGLSPYHLHFRRMLHRLLLATQRANDLRVYQDGDLSLGVRPGRCVIGAAPRQFTGVAGLAVSANATTFVWLDSSGALQTGANLPADRTSFLPLAQVVTGAATVSDLIDLRGQALLLVPSLPLLGVTTPAARINAALTGSAETVDAAALNTLTAGPFSTADAEHRHLQVAQDVNGQACFALFNYHAGAAANVALAFSLPNRPLDDLLLSRDLVNGFVTQTCGAATYHAVGAVHAQHRHEGDLTQTQAGKLMGVVPIDGTVTDVILSVGTNLQSSQSTDGLWAVAKVNGAELTTTHPKLTSAAGAGFRSTARGQGATAVVKADGTQNVLRGDVLSVDLVREAAGNVSTQAANVVALVVIRAKRPE